MFAKVYEKYGNLIDEEECIFIIGRPESSGDAIKIHIEEVVPLEDAKEKFTQSVKICLDKQRNTPEKIKELKNILDKNKGNLPVYLQLGNNGSKSRLFFLKESKIKITEGLIKEIENSFGENSIVLTKK
jgi:DNA polymerase-3 subunit alpha